MQPRVESLERRDTPSTTVGRGMVVVQGTEARDVVVVQADAANDCLVVSFNGELSFSRLSSVQAVVADLGGGNDYFGYTGPQSGRADAGLRLRELRVDGGAVVNDALMQFQADLLRVPVVRPRTTETTALGAAYLAGLASGFWKNRTEIAALWQTATAFRPRASAAALRRQHAAWRRAVDRARDWAM